MPAPRLRAGGALSPRPEGTGDSGGTPRPSESPPGPRSPQGVQGRGAAVGGRLQPSAAIQTPLQPPAGAPSGLSHWLLSEGGLLHPAVLGTHGRPR